jgi:hypothetical protein
VSVALAEFQFFLFIAIISGAAGRRRSTLILRKAEEKSRNAESGKRKAGG